MLLKDRNRCMLLIGIQIWLGHCNKLNIRLFRCDLLSAVYVWLHWFTLYLFLWAIQISRENSICWCLGVSILIYRFSHSNVSHLSSHGAYITANLIIVNIGLSLIGISYMNKLVLVGWIGISQRADLVLYIISKLRPLLLAVIIIDSYLNRLNHTRNHIGLLILLVVLHNLIMHPLEISRYHYNSYTLY